jgi:serine/threonine-protein kinase
VAEFERLIAAELTHPAIATPLATGISGVSAFLVQDYVAADSLDLAVREYGPAPAGNALRVAAQLGGALDFAAAVQVTHGALHPRDILLSSDDTRLTGLGVTRALERIGVVAPVRRPYTAPERIGGGTWDRRADVFSLAALMHELMWGRRVSGLGAQAAGSLTAIGGADLAALQTVFARALAEDPADRFQTALEFADALKDACPGVAVAPEPAPAPKRRAVREEEPRLPLDEEPEEAHEPAAEVVQAFRPATEPEADLKVRTTPEPDVAQGFSPADLDLAPVFAPEIVYQPALEAPKPPAPYEAPTAIPAGLITGHDSDALSALDRTRSAVWPLVLALIVGIGIGFAGGFVFGSREQTPASVVATAQSAAPVSAGKEFTESAIAAAAPPAAPAPTAANSELKTQNSEPKTLKSEIINLKSPAPDGHLLVRSRPAGAKVSVDGKAYGVTPAAIRDLARGAHRVTITHDGYAAQERRFVITASRPAQSMTVALARERAAAPSRAQAQAAPASRFTGALSVDSRPSGAKVFVDGKLVGTTPMALPSVAAGSHAVRLEHDGYRRWSSSVRIVASEQNRVTASLER